MNMSSNNNNNNNNNSNNNNPPVSLPMAKVIPVVKRASNILLEGGTSSMSMDNSRDGAFGNWEVPPLSQIVCSLRDVEDYSFYIFTSSYDQ
jgi:hypothetical protein